LSTFRIARWLVLTAAGGFIVLALLAGWLLREQIFQTFQDPGEPFQTYTPPDAADYGEASGWFVHEPLVDDDMPAVFFVHSTTYSGGANWNAELDKENANQQVVNEVIPNFAAPFADSGALYVPRYRQASLYTFMNNREDSILAREFASADVARAFDSFLEQIGEERAFIIAGVGQGGLHALRLGMDYLAADDALRARLIALYILDHPVPFDLLEGPLAPLPPCDTPEDVRCLYAYSQALPSEERRLRIMTERTMSWTPAGGLDYVDGRRLLCTNPLLSQPSNQYASARLHRGGAAATGLELGVNPAAIPQQTGAQCMDGVLFTERTASRLLRRPSRIAEDYREPPFNLFYEDLRLDAARRSLILSSILQEERRWAPPLEQPEDVEEAPVIPIPDRRDGY